MQFAKKHKGTASTRNHALISGTTAKTSWAAIPPAARPRRRYLSEFDINGACPMTEHVVVIGGGPAGLTAADRATQVFFRSIFYESGTGSFPPSVDTLEFA